jgi:hypothetical protein
MRAYAIGLALPSQNQKKTLHNMMLEIQTDFITNPSLEFNLSISHNFHRRNKMNYIQQEQAQCPVKPYQVEPHEDHLQHNWPFQSEPGTWVPSLARYEALKHVGFSYIYPTNIFILYLDSQLIFKVKVLVVNTTSSSLCNVSRP